MKNVKFKVSATYAKNLHILIQNQDVSLLELLMH